MGSGAADRNPDLSGKVGSAGWAPLQAYGIPPDVSREYLTSGLVGQQKADTLGNEGGTADPTEMKDSAL